MRVSASFLIGVDISAGEDISVVQIVRRIGNSVEIVNTLYGREAEEMYEKLVNEGIKKIKAEKAVKEAEAEE